MMDMEINQMTKLPKASIEVIVNRFHVGTADETIANDMRRRVRQNPNVTESFEKRMVAYALKVHHENQKLYGFVMGGIR
jgi:hypothetical protein